MVNLKLSKLGIPDGVLPALLCISVVGKFIGDEFIDSAQCDPSIFFAEDKLCQLNKSVGKVLSFRTCLLPLR